MPVYCISFICYRSWFRVVLYCPSSIHKFPIVNKRIYGPLCYFCRSLLISQDRRPQFHTSCESFVNSRWFWCPVNPDKAFRRRQRNTNTFIISLHAQNHFLSQHLWKKAFSFEIFLVENSFLIKFTRDSSAISILPECIRKHFIFLPAGGIAGDGYLVLKGVFICVPYSAQIYIS